MKTPTTGKKRSRADSRHREREKGKTSGEEKIGNHAGRPKRELPSETLSKMLDAVYGPDAVKQLQKTMPEPWIETRAHRLRN